MRPMRPLRLTLPLLVVWMAPPPGPDPPAIKALKQKGLTRSGRFFLIDAERTVLEKWKAARAALADLGAAEGRKDAADLAARTQEALERRRVELQRLLDELNQQVSEQVFQQGFGRPGGFGPGDYVAQLFARREMIRMGLAEVTSTLAVLEADVGPDPEALESEARKSREAATAALAALRASVDAAQGRYDELGADVTVRSALQALEKEKMGRFRLGPSAAFRSAARALEEAERAVLAKRPGPGPRKKGRLRR